MLLIYAEISAMSRRKCTLNQPLYIPSLRDGLFRRNLLTSKHRRDGARPVSTLRRTTPPQTIFAETHAVRLLFGRGCASSGLSW
ncbi:MAG: hypothetical protein LBD59_11140 [Prevotellaceae bacterium]|nr:hypothetical protein [Prevotellaceae bacterium]